MRDRRHDSQLSLPFMEISQDPNRGLKADNDGYKAASKIDPEGYHFRIVRRTKSAGDREIFPTKRDLNKLGIKSLEDAKFNSFKECVEAAIQCGVSLNGADLTNTLGLLEKLELPETGANGIQNKIKLYSLAGGDYRGGDFRNTNISGINFSDSLLDDCDLSGDKSCSELEKNGYKGLTTEAENVKFSGCSMKRIKLNNAVLNGAEFSVGVGTDPDTIETTYCDLTDAELNNVVLSRARFSETILGPHTQISVDRDFDISNAHFSRLDFTCLKLENGDNKQDKVGRFPLYAVHPNHYQGCSFPQAFGALANRQKPSASLRQSSTITRP